MSFRFTRRRRIAPGVRLNLSKSGPSVSFGGRGLHYTVGHGRRRTTVGVPGTGLYYTSTGHHSRGRRSSARTTRPAPPKKGLTPTIRESPGVGIAVGLITVAIGVALLAILPLALPLIAIGLYCLVLGVSVVANPHHRVARILAKAHRNPSTAEATLHAGLVDFPGNPEILTGLAGIWAATDRQVEAAAAWKEILAADPSNATLQGELAASLLHLGRWREAIPLLDAIREHPQLEEESRFSVIAHLALAHMALGDNQQAFELANSAPLLRHAMPPSLQECLFMRAAARYFLGHHAPAVKDLDRLYALAPEFRELSEAKAGMADGSFHLEYAGHPVAGHPKSPL